MTSITGRTRASVAERHASAPALLRRRHGDAAIYFHFQDGRKIEDKEGTELPDVKAARIEAIATGGTMLRDTASYWDGTEWQMQVTDESGATLFILRFSAEIPKSA